jgi:uncharacterized membrane protein
MLYYLSAAKRAREMHRMMRNTEVTLRIERQVAKERGKHGDIREYRYTEEELLKIDKMYQPLNLNGHKPK